MSYGDIYLQFKSDGLKLMAAFCYNILMPRNYVVTITGFEVDIRTGQTTVIFCITLS